MHYCWSVIGSMRRKHCRREEVGLQNPQIYIYIDFKSTKSMHYISPFSPATSIGPWPDVSWSGTKSKLVSNHRSLQIQWSYCKLCTTSAFACFAQSFAWGSRKTKNKEGKKRKEERKERKNKQKNKRWRNKFFFSNALPTCFSCYAIWKHSLWNLNNCNTRRNPTLKLTILVKFKE